MLILVSGSTLSLFAVSASEPLLFGVVLFAADTFLSPLNKPLIKSPNSFDEALLLLTDFEFTNDSLSLTDTETDSLLLTDTETDSLSLTYTETDSLSLFVFSLLKATSSP